MVSLARDSLSHSCNRGEKKHATFPIRPCTLQKLLRAMLPTLILKNAALPCLALFSIAAASAKQADPSPDFSDFYELEPITIVGEEVPIAVFARTSGDRNYATRFTHNVVEVAYDTLQKSPGAGLVIVGRSGEPHPIRLLESFMEKAKAEGASPELRQIAEEIESSTAAWRRKIKFDLELDEEQDELPFDPDKLIDAFPLPLPQMAAQLYLVAWEQGFDQAEVDQRLSTLAPSDLQQQEFKEYRWIFYLPPRDSLNKVLKEILPAALKASELGPIKRALVRAAIATFKPLIRDAMEGVRRGVLYWSVITANADSFGDGDIEALAQAYIESQMPRGKIFGSDKKEAALEATQEQKRKNEDYAKDPFVILEPVDDFDPAAFAPFFGRYANQGHRPKRFFEEAGKYYWQEGDEEPTEYLPAGNLRFVSTKKDATIEFLPDETQSEPKVELRQGRSRRTFDRLDDSP